MFWVVVGIGFMFGVAFTLVAVGLVQRRKKNSYHDVVPFKRIRNRFWNNCN